MHRLNLLIATFFTTSAAFAVELVPVKTMNVGTRPESVCRGFNDKLYISVMNSGGTPGDGIVRMIDGDTVTDFASGMDEPKGMAFVGDHLVVTDEKRVWKIDSAGKATILADAAAFPFPVSYLNDAAAAADGKSVFVTDMGDNGKMFGAKDLWPLDSPEAEKISVIGRVYQISMEGKVTLVIDADEMMLNPNGVTAPEDGVLLVTEFFKGNILSYRGGKFTLLESGLRGADAIEKGANGELYISSWTQGKVWKIPATGKPPEVIISGHQSAADFFLDRRTNLLILPDMLAGTLSFYQL